MPEIGERDGADSQIAFTMVRSSDKEHTTRQATRREPNVAWLQRMSALFTLLGNQDALHEVTQRTSALGASTFE
ncbi:hypothetical protein VTG60DRAFT_3736 [Thermothelomyces hinnuleus]